ncbi:putative chaperonin TCP-1, chaperonin Cpn60/TCP-1 family, groEL-like equatorial domain superfamily [Dioscorea sansibarensis]
MAVVGSSIEQQPQIILLKEGTDTSQGKAQVVSNINACSAVVDAVRTTLGPRGMDKLIHDDKGNTTISNDGATIMKLFDKPKSLSTSPSPRTPGSLLLH